MSVHDRPACTVCRAVSTTIRSRVDVPERQVGRASVSVSGGLLARREPDPVEAAQPAQRLLDPGPALPGVELHHLVAGPVAGVEHVDADPHLAAGVHLGRAQPQVAVLEAGVAQAVPERVQRAAAEVQVGRVAADDVVVEQVGQVRGGAVPGLRQPPGGLDRLAVRVAEQHVGQRRAVLLPAVRGPQDRRQRGRRPSRSRTGSCWSATSTVRGLAARHARAAAPPGPAAGPGPRGPRSPGR